MAGQPEAPLTFRVSPIERELLEAAAAVENRPLGAFVRIAAVERARQILDPQNLAAVSPGGSGA